MNKSNVEKLLQKKGFQQWSDYYTYSLQREEDYIKDILQHFHVSWKKEPSRIRTTEKGIPYTRYVEDGEINTAEWILSLYENEDDIVAVAHDERGNRKEVTVKEWRTSVKQYAAFFYDQGVRARDTILLYMPMTLDTLYVFLACDWLGATLCPVFSGFKRESVRARIEAVEGKWLVTVDETIRRGTIVSPLEEVLPLLDMKSSLQKIFYIKNNNFNNLNRENCEEIQYNKNVFPRPSVSTLQHANFVLFTSGTTGKPKAIAHHTFTFALKSAWDAYLGWDVKEKSRIFWYTDLGWMMGAFLFYSALLNKGTMYLFEGVLEYESKEFPFQWIERECITHFGISPSWVRFQKGEWGDAVPPYTLPTLRAWGSTGEPWTEEHWLWLYEQVGRKRHLFNYSGGTEISGGIFANIPSLLIQPCAFNTPLPGMDVKIVGEEKGNRKFGELLLQKPWLGMTYGFYRDESNQYTQTYWTSEEEWRHGDFCEQQNGHYWIRGRSDDTLNIAGKRIGPNELESVISTHPSIKECAVVSIPHELKGEVPFVFYVTNAPFKGKGDVLAYQQSIAHTIGKMFVPIDFCEVNDLPKTRNGKVMRRLLKKLLLNESLGDTSSLVNAHVLIDIERIVKQQGRGRKIE